MKLRKITIKNFRSITNPLEFDFESNLCCFIGENNSGKSNVLKSLNMALNGKSDSDEFKREIDYPAVDSLSTGFHGKPETTFRLEFNLDKTRRREKTLLDMAAKYEQAVAGITRFADEDKIVFYVNYTPNGTRQERIITASGNKRLKDPAMLDKLLTRFHQAIHYVYLPSSRDVRHLLESYLTEEFMNVLFSGMGKSKTEQEAIRRAKRLYDDFVKHIDKEILGEASEALLEELKKGFVNINNLLIRTNLGDSSKLISDIDVSLEDEWHTGLANKGSGIQSAVLIALMNFLYRKNPAEVIVGIEEPEAFLHPSAQKRMLDALSNFSESQQIFFTTHSPLMFPDCEDIFVIEKGGTPVSTRLVGSGGELARTRGLWLLYDQEVSHVIAEEIANLLTDFGPYNILVEGVTDKDYLELAALKHKTKTGRDLLEEDIKVLKPVGTRDGATSLGRTVILLHLANKLGVKTLAILDNDSMGKDVGKSLEKFGFQNNKDFIYLTKSSFPANWEVEIEDLIPIKILEEFVKLHPEAAEEKLEKSQKKRIIIRGKPLTIAGKEHDYKPELVHFWSKKAKYKDFAEFVELLNRARKRLGLEKR